MQLDLDLSPRAAALHRIAGRRVIASISGGRDSAAMSLYLTELGVEHERVFMDTGWESAITYDYLRGPLTDKLGPITEIRGDLDFVQLVEKKGLFPSRVMRFCTEELKVRPVQRWLERGAERDRALGRAVVPRSMFSFHGGDNKHHPINIDEAIEWGNSARGEWQPPGAGDGCMRWGVCETAVEAG